MISFVIIGKNEGWRLKKCLCAVYRRAKTELKQPYEIIYVDSKSTDGSIELAKKYADRVILITGECNAAIGRNIGAEEAQGNILFFLDGDMELREGVLSTIFKADGSLEYPFMSGIEYEYLYDKEWKLVGERPRRSIKEKCRHENVTGGLFVMTNKLWHKIGGMDSRFSKGEDYDLGFRACKLGYKNLRYGNLWVNHYTQEYAIRNKNVKAHQFSSLLARKHFFNQYAIGSLFCRFYSAYVLILSILFLLVFHSAILILLYLIVLLYRTISTIKKTTAPLNWFVAVKERFYKDCLFIYAFIMFHPSYPILKYQRQK